MYSCAKRINPNLILFEENRDFAIFEDWMYHFVNLRCDKIYIVDSITYHVNDHDDRSMMSNHSIIIQKIKISKKWIINKVKLNLNEIKELNAFVHYFSAMHAYSDNASTEAIKELYEAYRIKGLCLAYATLCIKCILGKKLISVIKLVLGNT